MKTSKPSRRNPEITTVIDAGARYGIHPSWKGYDSEVYYYAFEPDNEEVQRLQNQPLEPNSQIRYEVLALALGSKRGKATLHLHKHRGCSSLLEADLNSTWFTYRPTEGNLEKKIEVELETVDCFSLERGLIIDFMKVDTEGTELEVLLGAANQLENVLGLRVQVNFQPAFKGQSLFPEIHNFLLAKDFYLLNLDYLGRGIPRNSFFRNPDPTQLDNERYGTLVAADGVWLKKPEVIFGGEVLGPDIDYAVLKYAHFCMLNHAPDIAIETLLDHAKNTKSILTGEVTSSMIYRSLRRTCAAFLGRYRVVQDQQWEMAALAFKSVFGIELPGGSRFWELIQAL